MNSAPRFLNDARQPGAQPARRLGTLLLAALLPGLFLATLPAQAATYLVDGVNGNDSWSGTSSNYTGGTTGPFQSFRSFNLGGSLAPNFSGPPAGTIVYARGLIDHTSDSIATALDLYYALGTSNNPIVFSNWPGDTCIISNSGPNIPPLALSYCSWVKIFGINCTNSYRPPSFTGDLNCEYAYSYAGGGSPALGSLNVVTMDNNCQSNWVHDCTFGPSCPYNNGGGDGGAHGFTMGTFYATTDQTSYNIIENNVFFHSGHDVLSVYGPNNVIQCNWGHSAPWYAFAGVAWGSRDLELGGSIGNSNLVQYNHWDYAGYVPDEGCHGIEMSDGAYEIVRYNYCLNDSACGIIVYGGKVGGTVSCSNYIYNNTLAFNGFNATTNVSDGSPTNISYPVWQSLMAFNGTGTNFVVNNLAYDDFNYGLACFDGGSVDVARSAGNLYGVDPIFVNTNTIGGEFYLALTNCLIQSNSPAIDAGTWLAYVTSPSGSGSAFTVDNAGYFNGATYTAASRTIAPDAIQLQGQTNTVYILSISNNTITVNGSLTWTNGQGVALPYAGNGPDAGACEYGLVPPGPPPPPPTVIHPPSNLHIVVNYAAIAAQTALALEAVGVDATNLAAWWPLDDLTGLDASGNGATLSFVGSPTSASGQITNSVGFNGTTQYAHYAPLTGFPTGTAAITLTCWFKLASTTEGGGAIFGIGGNAAGGDRITLLWTGSGIQSEFQGFGSGLVSWTPDLNWHFLALALPSGGVAANSALYFDGVLQSVTAPIGSINIDSAGEIGIATIPTYHSAYLFNGWVDDPRIYARALTGTEISTIYSHGQTGSP